MEAWALRIIRISSCFASSFVEPLKACGGEWAQHVLASGSPRSTRFCFNLDSALPSSNLCFLMFISAEIAGSRVTAMHPASASRHHSSHDRTTVARCLALREARLFDVWNTDPRHFFLSQGLHRITPRNSLIQTYQIVGPSAYRGLSQTAAPP